MNLTVDIEQVVSQAIKGSPAKWQPYLELKDYYGIALHNHLQKK